MIGDPRHRDSTATAASSAVRDRVSVAGGPSLASWLSTLGISPPIARQYAELMHACGLDPCAAVTDESALEAAGVSDPLHRRKIELTSCELQGVAPPARADGACRRHSRDAAREPAPRRARAVRGLSASPRLQRPLSLAHARAVTLEPWTTEQRPLSVDDLNQRPGFSELALPILARVHRRRSSAPAQSSPCVRARFGLNDKPRAHHAAPPGGGGGGGECYYELSGCRLQPGGALLAHDVREGRRPPAVLLPEGSHAFVSVPGERGIRVAAHSAPFGLASGHSQLSSEGRVLFAGEVLVGKAGRLLAWSNMSGTYRPSRELAAQVRLPIELLWSVLDARQARELLGGREPTPSALDGRFGKDSWVRAQGAHGVLLVRDEARVLSSQTTPPPPPESAVCARACAGSETESERAASSSSSSSCDGSADSPTPSRSARPVEAELFAEPSSASHSLRNSRRSLRDDDSARSRRDGGRRRRRTSYG